jgi:hypothetical protein
MMAPAASRMDWALPSIQTHSPLATRTRVWRCCAVGTPPVAICAKFDRTWSRSSGWSSSLIGRPTTSSGT